MYFASQFHILYVKTFLLCDGIWLENLMDGQYDISPPAAAPETLRSQRFLIIKKMLEVAYLARS
jgi:hypothetical protein